MPAARAVVQALEQSLIRAKNADGGWPYHRGKTSRLEATCWALLALGEGAASPRILENWPEAEDLLLERRDGAPNYAFHALAVITLSALDVTHQRGNGAMVGALQRVGGEALPPSTINRQDNSLRGWSWIAGTFSWVEPTAWCLLALKRSARAGVPVDSGRIGIAERLLVDRCCKSGGWNYGNSNMLGQDLRPFVPPTALALLAMGDRRALPEVERSIDFLERAAVTEMSGTALSLAFIALSILGRPVSAVRDALLAQIPTTLAFGNQMAAAMSLYALRAEDGHEAFAL